ncbi:unnamed protein product, partial [Rotaria sordida]
MTNYNLSLILVNDTAGPPAHSSALCLITTHQLKCNPLRHPQYSFALVSPIEKYLHLCGIVHSTI